MSSIGYTRLPQIEPSNNNFDRGIQSVQLATQTNGIDERVSIISSIVLSKNHIEADKQKAQAILKELLKALVAHGTELTKEYSELRKEEHKYCELELQNKLPKISLTEIGTELTRIEMVKKRIAAEIKDAETKIGHGCDPRILLDDIFGKVITDFSQLSKEEFEAALGGLPTPYKTTLQSWLQADPADITLSPHLCISFYYLLADEKIRESFKDSLRAFIERLACNPNMDTLKRLKRLIRHTDYSFEVSMIRKEMKKKHSEWKSITELDLRTRPSSKLKFEKVSSKILDFLKKNFPNVKVVDWSHNEIRGLPYTFRSVFPKLTTLALDNVTPSTVAIIDRMSTLRVLYCTNVPERLTPRKGLIVTPWARSSAGCSMGS